MFQLLTLWKWIWIQVGRSAKIFCSTFRNNRSQDRCRPQLIEGLGIQELPPGKDFPLNLRQLRFVADLLPMPDNRVDCASLARLQVKLFSGSKASRKARPAVRLRNQHRLIGLILRPNLRGDVVGGVSVRIREMVMLPNGRLNSLAVACDPHFRQSFSRPIFHSADLPQCLRANSYIRRLSGLQSRK